MKRGRIALLGAALAVAVLATVLWSQSRRPSKPSSGGRPVNVLLITIDTLRADRLGCYGNAAAGTPAIDRLAAEGVLFEQASTCVPLTLPSHASILTGTWPAFHGTHNNGTYKVDDSVVTLAESLRERGYRTGAVIGAFPLASRFGLTQGFDTYDDTLPQEGERRMGYRQRTADRVTSAGLQWLEATEGKPFFLWLHYFDPHTPYAPPEPFAARFRGRPYDGEIAFVDEQVGRVLERVRRPGLASSTLVVLMSDHGEGLGDHGEWTHGVFLYESTLRVPLVMALPGVLPAGRRVGQPVRSIDVLPTVLELLRAPIPAQVQGESLRPLFEGGGATPPRVVLAETRAPRENYAWSDLDAIRVGGLKYIRAPRAELYDLSADPGETENRLTDRPDDATRLAADLDRRLAEASRHAPDGSGPREPDDETRKRLASLGYISSPGPARGAPLPDPKDRIAVLELLDRGVALASDGRLDEAIATYTRALAADPGNPTVYERRGNARLTARDYRGAKEDYAKVLASYPDRLESLQNMGMTLYGLGDLKGAEVYYSRVLALAPDSPRTLASLGILRQRQERPDEANEFLKRALELEDGASPGKESASPAKGSPSTAGTPSPAPGFVDRVRTLYEAGRFEEIVTLADAEIRGGHDGGDLRFVRGNALFRLGKVVDAEADYRRAREADPDDARPLFGLALVALRQGKTGEAIRNLEEAKRIDPHHAEVARNLAILYDEAGRTGEAIAAYQSALALTPDALELRFFLGRALAKQGRKAEARAQFQAYLDGGATEYRDAARSALAGLK